MPISETVCGNFAVSKFVQPLKDSVGIVTTWVLDISAVFKETQFLNAYLSIVSTVFGKVTDFKLIQFSKQLKLIAESLESCKLIV